MLSLLAYTWMWFFIGFAAGRYRPRDKLREEFDRKYAHLWKLVEKR